MKPELRQALSELIMYYFVTSDESGGADWDRLNDLMNNLALQWVRFKKEEA